MKYTDKESIDTLQKLQKGYGKGWICRFSENGRGIRLHESSNEKAKPTIREAIEDFLNEQLAEKPNQVEDVAKMS